LESGTSNPLFSIFFPDANTGYAVGRYGTILKTDDGGGPVGVIENKPTSKTLKLYPNPAHKNLTIEPVEKGVLYICNLNGTLFLQKEITKSNTIIDISSLPNGIYVLKFVEEKGLQVVKFVKN
jgi:photosystem II stability/assembly factor-like uncharacterized protein